MGKARRDFPDIDRTGLHYQVMLRVVDQDENALGRLLSIVLDKTQTI